MPLYLGCISGTSVDGLDIACVRIDDSGAIHIVAGATVAIPATLRSTLLKLANPSPGELDLLGAADSDLGRFIGLALRDFMAAHQIDPSDVRAVGSHGQTVRHRPPGQHTTPFTLQIGDPNHIVEITGVPVVADIRRRDMAAGGQGAPLVPPFHKALFGVADTTTVVANVGGISNITVLGAQDAPLTGFDTGPGNALMDLWHARHRNAPFDAAGNWAQGGTVLHVLLGQMLADPYFSRPPPKSTGREYFNAQWLEQFRIDDYPAQDVQATLCELTATCIVNAMPTAAATIVLCGGGRHNTHLLRRLNALSHAQVVTSEALGVDGDLIEAAAFAWLAHRTVRGEAGNAPGVTGAEGPRLLGAVYNP